jgi:hypothetical protein
MLNCVLRKLFTASIRGLIILCLLLLGPISPKLPIHPEQAPVGMYIANATIAIIIAIAIGFAIIIIITRKRPKL